MNPNTYLVPILGIYGVELTKNGQAMPVYFVMMRNVQEFNRDNLDYEDIVH